MTQLEKIMSALGVNEAEARQILADDAAIDKGAKLFELSDEQKKAAKEASRADSKPRAAPTKREPKVDKDKAEIMQVLDDALCDLVDDVQERINDRELIFIYNEKKFKITLSCPRS